MVISNEKNTYSKGRALMQMYRVVLQTKRGNYSICDFDICYMVLYVESNETREEQYINGMYMYKGVTRV